MRLLLLLVAFAIGALLCCVDADPMGGQENQLVRHKRWGYGYGGGWGGGGWGGGGWGRWLRVRRRMGPTRRMGMGTTLINTD
uniref:Uncharacterized protein n=1 Tax=Globodera pallida TaxID=36090 RepID=A0A183CEL8_GLOPA